MVRYKYTFGNGLATGGLRESRDIFTIISIPIKKGYLDHEARTETMAYTRENGPKINLASLAVKLPV